MDFVAYIETCPAINEAKEFMSVRLEYGYFRGLTSRGSANIRLSTRRRGLRKGNSMDSTTQKLPVADLKKSDAHTCKDSQC